MNSETNLGAVEKIQQLALESDSYTYLVIDDRGILLERGGELVSADLSEWKIGDNILESALFLLGNIPMSSDYESIICYQLSDSCIIDVHLFRDEHFAIVVLVDRSEDMGDEARVRQSKNEEKLRRRYGK
tara:strand:- start:205 stop:594 length:390 start_codon:yes stop_codon:yes gene_type:complete